MKQKLTLLFALVVLTWTGVFSQRFKSPIKPALAGFHFTLVDYHSPNRIDSTSLREVFKQGDIFKPTKQSSAFTLSYWKGLSRHFDFSGKFNGIFYDYELNRNPPGRTEPYNNEFGAELEAAINVHPLSDAHFFQPFLTAGIGGGHYTADWGAYAPVGIGFQFNIRSTAYFFLQTQYRFSLTKDIFPNNLLHSLGVAVNITRDRPAPPPPVQMPIMEVKDRDGDGIVDSLDACPDQAGPAALNGCPDRDGDGIADKDDACPDVAGLAKYKGCPVPDTDHDGINDEEDKCPTVPGVARYQGCPIPDTDGDGVNDEEDKCPNQPGPASNFGCPVIPQAQIEIVNKSAKNIFFAFGSAKLLGKSFPSLNNVVRLLKDNPTYRVDISGHTDTVGTAERNHTLSHARADAVKAYFISQGIDESRMTAEGYGFDRPIASNKTAAGRAKNRRVEMVLKNY